MPRRPRAEKASTVRKCIRMTKAEEAELAAVAALNLTNVSDFMRDAILTAVAECTERRAVVSSDGIESA